MFCYVFYWLHCTTFLQYLICSEFLSWRTVLLNAISACVAMALYFSLFILTVWYNVSIKLQILWHPTSKSKSNITPVTWFFVCCWISFTNFCWNYIYIYIYPCSSVYQSNISSSSSYFVVLFLALVLLTFRIVFHWQGLCQSNAGFIQLVLSWPWHTTG